VFISFHVNPSWSYGASPAIWDTRTIECSYTVCTYRLRLSNTAAK